VLLPRPLAAGERVEAYGFPTVACLPGEDGCWDDQAQLLDEAAAKANAMLGESFFVCREATDLARGVGAGCRPVLVLGERSLDEVLGPGEPLHKEMAAALDLATAAHYMVEEAAQAQVLGPFPFGAQPVREERPARSPLSSGDMLKILALVVATGLAIALGLAYLLQEIYQRVTFPPIAYWLTLQFIPQTWRGLLFLLIGATTGLLLPRLLASVDPRRRYR
jgi:hypothetical protein